MKHIKKERRGHCYAVTTLRSLSPLRIRSRSTTPDSTEWTTRDDCQSKCKSEIKRFQNARKAFPKR
eukprot:143382-Prorocentrum_minimum.AAC.1